MSERDIQPSRYSRCPSRHSFNRGHSWFGLTVIGIDHLGPLGRIGALQFKESSQHSDF
jgi:hypothetical protein